MNVDSEQITLDKSLAVSQDQPLSGKQLQDCLINVLGKNKLDGHDDGEPKSAVVWINDGGLFEGSVRRYERQRACGT